jgi:hypothetical protein
MASFTFLYTNNDSNTTVISARILRKAPSIGKPLYIQIQGFFLLRVKIN